MPWRSRTKRFLESELNLRRDPLYCSDVDLRMPLEYEPTIDVCHLCNRAVDL
jgi:hypothetical protein